MSKALKALRETAIRVYMFFSDKFYRKEWGFSYFSVLEIKVTCLFH